MKFTIDMVSLELIMKRMTNNEKCQASENVYCLPKSCAAHANHRNLKLKGVEITINLLQLDLCTRIMYSYDVYVKFVLEISDSTVKYNL